MNLESILVGFKQFPVIGLSIILGFAFFSFVSYKLFSFLDIKKKNGTFISSLLILLFLFLLPSSFSFFVNKYIAYQYFMYDLKKNISLPKNTIHASKGKNLLLIYLESFESEFTESKYFPHLTPFLQEFQKKSISFDANYQTQGADYSIAGMFTSQCGAPFQYRRTENLVCLGDILDIAGYQQVFMQGSDMDFEDIGRYYTTHGYDELYGKKKLPPIGDKTKLNTWGLTDEDLFEYAFKEFDQLNQNFIDTGKPFNLTLFTSDTHNGVPSRNCPKYHGLFAENHFFQSYHCTDYLLKKFILRILSQPGRESLVITILGDHLQNFDMYASQLDGMGRRVLALINTPDNTTHKINEKTSHADITPTLLSLLKIKHNVHFLFGKDILYENEKNLVPPLNFKKNIYYNIIKSKTWFGSIGGKEKILDLYSYGSNIKAISKQEIKKYFFPKIKTYQNLSKKQDKIFYSVHDNMLFIKTDKPFEKVHITFLTDENKYFNGDISYADAMHFENEWYVWTFGNHFKVKNLKINIITKNRNTFPIPINIKPISPYSKITNNTKNILLGFSKKNPLPADISSLKMQYSNNTKKVKFFISDNYKKTAFSNRIKYKVVYKKQNIFVGDIGDEHGTKKHYIEFNLSPEDKNVTIILEPQKNIETNWSWGDHAQLKIDFFNGES